TPTKIAPARNRSNARARAIEGSRARKSTAVILFFRVTACTIEQERLNTDRQLIQVCAYQCSSVVHLFRSASVPHIQLQPEIALPAVDLKFVCEINPLIRLRHGIDFFNPAPPDCLYGSIIFAGDSEL